LGLEWGWSGIREEELRSCGLDGCFPFKATFEKVYDNIN